MRRIGSAVAVIALAFASGCGIGTSASGTNSDPLPPGDGIQFDRLAHEYNELPTGFEPGAPLPGTPAETASNARLITAGHDFSCAIDAAGGVRCWGHVNGHDTAPLPIEGLANITAISASAGGEHVCALDAVGTVQCFGQNDAGQLGDGSSDGSAAPVAVTGLTAVTSIAAGARHSCAVAGGVVSCWGDNEDGALGADPDTLDGSLTALDVAGVPASKAVAAGGRHACALALDGTVVCWGANDRGQLGRTASNTPGAPEAIAGLTGVTSLVTGEEHTCAATANNVACWGGNGLGQLGVGSRDDAATPTPSKAAGSATALSAGFDSGCAVQNGGAKCWGNNDGGQVGSGLDGDLALEPVDVSGLTSGVLAVASGRDHACALLDGGAVKCWGENDHDQLGNDDGGSRVPVDVSF